MSAAFILAILLIIYSICKFLNLFSQPTIPKIICNDSKFLEIVLKYCPHLREPYVPVRLWGTSGHIQTLVHATLGRTYCPTIKGRRCGARQEDGATLTWDVYEPKAPSQYKEPHTIVVCPGIANSSESAYVRSLVALAADLGFSCVVLNHIGVLPHVPVTSARVFRYGRTDEYHLMLTKYLETCPESRLVLVGFSMGGNIVCKYLGENRPSRPDSNIIGAISICQGYDALRSLSYLLEWRNLARVYLYSMTEIMRSVILRNRDVLLSEDLCKRAGVDEGKVRSAATLPELDEVYTRRVFGFNTTEELYLADSSSNYLNNIRCPLILMNAADDPLVSERLLNIPTRYASSQKRRNPALYLETQHGGHLGYYDGGVIVPSAVTWLDRTVVGMVVSLAESQALV